MLEVGGLTKRYGTILALDDVGFTVAPGQVVGFLGPNGAGKTTAMRAIMRLISLDAGEVTWNGEPVDAAVRQRFGYMPAERGMYPQMKVRDHVVYYARLSGLDPVAVGVLSEVAREQVARGRHCCSAATSSTWSPTCAPPW